MSTIIRYNGVNPFGTRTPIVALEEVLEGENGYISRVDRYTLIGTRPRPSCNATFYDYKVNIEEILGAFKLQFKSFEIIEDGQTVVYFNQAIVRSISIPEDKFGGFYQFEITIDCIHSFEDLGILDPQETYETSQDDSSITTIRHSISCRGVGPNGVDKAKQFIQNRESQLFSGSYASYVPLAFTPAKTSRVLSVNRLTAEVSLNITYLYNEDNFNSDFDNNVLTYTTELAETPEGTTITISGQIQGTIVGAVNEMSKSRLHFDQIDWQAIAQREWESWGGQSSLGDTISFSVTEAPLTSLVNFTLGWNTTSKEGAYIQDSLTLSQSYEGQPTCLRYQGTVRSDSGCISQRFEDVEVLFNMTDFRARALNLWALYGTGETISPEAKTLSMTRNEFAGTMTFEITMCHDTAYSCGCAENLDYSFDFTPSIEQYAAQPILRGLGNYSIQDLGFKNRQKFSIKGSARRVKCCTVEQAKIAIKTRMNFLAAQYFTVNDRILEVAQMDETDSGDQINFNFGWSGAA